MNTIIYAVLLMGLLIFCAHLFNALFAKTKIPNVLLLLIIGIAAGFFVNQKQFFGELGRVFTTITLVVIIFESGVNLKFSDLRKAIGPASMVTLFNFIASLIIVSTITHFFMNFDWTSAIFMGAVLGGTSSAVVIPMLKQMKMKEKSNNVLLLESALSDVLCLVVGLAALDGMKAGSLDVGSIFNSMWQSFVFAALIGIAAGFIWTLLLGFVRSAKNSMFTSLAYLFIVYAIVELLGWNGGIAALTLGIILGNSGTFSESRVITKYLKIPVATLRENELSFFSEIVFVLQTYFFVYVGISIQFSSFSTYLYGLLLVALIILVRPIGIKLFASKGVERKERRIMSVMTPKGLVAAVLASLPLQAGLSVGGIIQDLGYAIVLLSIIICSILVMIAGSRPEVIFGVLGDRMHHHRSSGDEPATSENPLLVDENMTEEENEPQMKSNEN